MMVSPACPRVLGLWLTLQAECTILARATDVPARGGFLKKNGAGYCKLARSSVYSYRCSASYVLIESDAGRRVIRPKFRFDLV